MRKNALKFMVPWILVALTLFSCGGGGGDSAPAPAPVPGNFTQADLAGTWDVLQFQTGADAGWMRAVATFNASGNLTSVTNFLDSTGSTTTGPLTVVWTLSSAGVVSETDGGANTGFHAQMSSDKKLVVGIVGIDNNATSDLTIARKRTGAVFSSTDLANIPFVSHGLFSGTDNTWEWAIGTTDSSGNVTLSSRTSPSGTQSGPFSNVAAISVSSVGTVTDSMDPSFYGIITDDKKVFFSVNTADVGMYNFMVGQVTGQTYTQADYAGILYFNVINSATLVKPGWAYGSGSIDNAGNGTYLTYKSSDNAPLPGPYTRVLSATGVVTDPASATSHGQFSYNKDLSVRTGTNTSGRHQLVIGIK